MNRDEDSVFRFTVPDAPPGEGQCDFCGAPSPAWDYPAADFDFEMIGPDGMKIVQRSIGEWSACEKCSNCIEADDYEALAQRSGGMRAFRHLPKAHQTPRIEAKMLAHVKAHFDHFRVHRTGARVTST
jgi:hypothetical protein